MWHLGDCLTKKNQRNCTKLYTCLFQATSESFLRFIMFCWWAHDVRVQVPSAPLLSPEVSPQAKWKPALQIGPSIVKYQVSSCCPNVVQMLSKCCPSMSKHCFDFCVLKHYPELTAGEAPVATPSPNVLVTQHSHLWDWEHAAAVSSWCIHFHVVSHRFASHSCFLHRSSQVVAALQVLDALLIELNELLEKASEERTGETCWQLLHAFTLCFARTLGLLPVICCCELFLSFYQCYNFLIIWSLLNIS